MDPFGRGLEGMEAGELVTVSDLKQKRMVVRQVLVSAS
jgi:uncharacterized protein YlxP (DUF503 family)